MPFGAQLEKDMESKKQSKLVGYGLDLLGIVLLIFGVYAVGRCTMGDGFVLAQNAEAREVATRDRPEPIERQALAEQDGHQERLEERAREQELEQHAQDARMEQMELEQTRRAASPNPALQVPMVQRHVIAAAPAPAPEVIAPPPVADEPGTSGSMQEDYADDAWTPLEVALGKLGISEASGREADVIAIVAARGDWPLDRLQREHPRALAAVGQGSRPWIAGLNAELTRPTDWPEDRVSWDERGRDGWRRTLQLVRRTLASGQGCIGGTPQIWGGRTLDATHIERRVAQGFRIVDCGPTANVYMRRDRAASR
jgi:hypothetical protein